MCTRGYQTVGKLVQFNISYLNCAYKIDTEYILKLESQLHKRLINNLSLNKECMLDHLALLLLSGCLTSLNLQPYTRTATLHFNTFFGKKECINTD